MLSSTPTMLNQSHFFEEQETPFFSFPSNLNFGCPILGHNIFQQSLIKTLTIPTSFSDINPNFTQTLFSTHQKEGKEDGEKETSFDLGGDQLFSLQRSTSNLWGVEEANHERFGIKRNKNSVNDHLGVSTMKMKKMKGRKKVREPRFCFMTLSDIDVLDDGYKWRKYGQKVVKNTQHPRSYYRCTQEHCLVKKRVERLAEDPRMVITTYEGRHAHSPSQELDDSQSPSHLNNFFW